MQAQSSLSAPPGTLLFPESDGDDDHVWILCLCDLNIDFL